jgi:hypothetical protein
MATLKEVTDRVGSLTATSKLSIPSYSLPAEECNVGARLAQVEGSTCSGCYVLQSNSSYSRFPAVKPAQYKRLESIKRADWVTSMIELITRKVRTENPYFRWHDSGDIQDLEHLRKIARVCEGTPHITHWLPTREYRVVNLYRKIYGDFPENLTVRLSAHMNNAAPPTTDLPTSTVTTDGTITGVECHATTDESSECGDCRACWSPHVENVTYHKH